jgi:hypothetical protein
MVTGAGEGEIIGEPGGVQEAGLADPGVGGPGEGGEDEPAGEDVPGPCMVDSGSPCIAGAGAGRDGGGGAGTDWCAARSSKKSRVSVELGGRSGE